MRKATKLYWLSGVLLVLCLTAFAVSRYQEKQEAIQTSGEEILALPADSVTALSWTNENGTFSFTKEDTWVYDDDTTFPVSEEKIRDLLSPFASFSAAFVIDEVEDEAQYGLDDPVCTISITAGEEQYTIRLGDFSKMDEQRYVSLGDGKVYLVTHDPLDEFDAVLRDLIQNDTIPAFDTVEQLTFTGDETYTVTRDEDGKSLCDDDVYFTDGKPLDTERVDNFLQAIQSLNLTNYVTYHASDEDLAAFGLDAPALTIDLSYRTEQEDGEEDETGELLLSLAQDPEEAAVYAEAVAKDTDEEELPDVTCYLRVGQSPIVYEISQSVYDQLTAVSYDALRHQELFTADFSAVTSIDVTLGGETYTFTHTLSQKEDDEDAEGTWTYNGTEFDADDLTDALCALSASRFTEETPTGQEEISLTVHLKQADFPTFSLTLSRYDGSNCLAAVDGQPVALVSRSQTVALIEAVHALTLGVTGST